MLGSVRGPGFSKTARSHIGHREAARHRFDFGALAIFAGGDADDLTKCAAEGAEAVEADIEADVGDAVDVEWLRVRAIDRVPGAKHAAIELLDGPAHVVQVSS